ncbi:MAG: YceI family protein [Proteobacteria bacterium]|jgi:polyisoprenoid-binding protein YceI|nr:YceI family protein [Pseudomonadota bacterium]
MRYLLFFICLTTTNLWAKTYTLKNGSATYTVTHSFKTVKGTSDQIKGKMVCEGTRCEYLIAIRTDSFKSSDSNRDLNMLTILDSEKFPLITIKGSFEEALLKEKNTKIQASVSFHGQEKTYELQLSEITQGKGSLVIDLEAHGVERPSLLTIKIKNEVPIDFDYVWSE